MSSELHPTPQETTRVNARRDVNDKFKKNSPDIMAVKPWCGIHQRHKAILEAVVREYVKTARPVSSKELCEIRHFPFSSATIRNDFQVLEELGFLYQPHISAGRIPTDKAYRFYIRNHQRAGVKKKTSKELCAFQKLMCSEAEGDEKFLRSAAAILAEISKGLTMAGIVDDQIFFKCGFSDVLEEPEFSDAERVRDFGRYVDDFEKSVDALMERLTVHRPEAFVGKENPIRSGKEYGMVVYAYERNSGAGKKKQMVSIVGPKRMDYERNMSLMEEFDEIVRQLYLK